MFETETDYNRIGSWGTKVMFKVETVDQAKHNLQEITKNWIGSLKTLKYILNCA